MPKQANQSVLFRRAGPSVSYRNVKVAHFRVTFEIHLKTYWNMFKEVFELPKPPFNIKNIKKEKKKKPEEKFDLPFDSKED